MLLTITWNRIPLCTSAHALNSYLLFMVNSRRCTGRWITSCPPPQSGTVERAKAVEWSYNVLCRASWARYKNKQKRLSFNWAATMSQWMVRCSDWGLVGTNANEEARQVLRLASMMCGPATKLSKDCKKTMYRDVKSTCCCKETHVKHRIRMNNSFPRS